MWIHQRQPNDYTCGPTCVAIITGAPLGELIREMRAKPDRGVNNTAVTRALKARGVKCGDRFVSVRGRALPHTAVVRIKYLDHERGHVLVKRDREWFDPLMSATFFGDPPKDHSWPVIATVNGVFSTQTWRIVSALIIHAS